MRRLTALSILSMLLLLLAAGGAWADGWNPQSGSQVASA
jgi:hypothetical protein